MSPLHRQSMSFRSSSHLSRREAVALLGSTMIAAPAMAAPRAICPIVDPLDRIAGNLLDQTPEMGCYGGVPGAMNGGPLARRMDDYSPQGEEAWRAALGEAGIAIEGVQCSGDPLGTLRLKISAELIANATRSAAIGYGRPNPFWFSGHEPYVINQISGPLVNTPNIMMAQQPVSTLQEVDAWIEKLDGFATGYAGVIEKSRADEALGCHPPRAILEKTLPVIDAFLAPKAADHPMIVALRTRMATAGIDPHSRALTEQRAATALDKRARPIFKKLRDRVSNMLETARDEAGLWAQPDGAALYAANIASVGDSNMSADEIHKIGLDQVKMLQAQLDMRLRQIGYSKGSILQRIDALAADPKQQFADTPVGREALLTYVRGLVSAMEARQRQFLPPAMIPTMRMEVRAVPAATQESAPGGYYDGPSLDGSRPGIYWINLRDMATLSRFKLPTLSYHEGVPGHHTQGAVSLSLPQAPLLLRIASFNAYQEGWALYAERLAADLGVYRTDPAGDVGRLADDLFRCVRLVVDTGLHHLRWSREEAIAYMEANSPTPHSEAVAEIERYMAWPGQALGYKLGQLRLLSMRDRFKARAGRRYSLASFHAKVLGTGAMPLDILEGLILPAA
ncbi:DUF885 domain-containing protein [Sphingomonas crocodyli]|uniref:DUF885 domain-containing protein n=2 Tax=Sphingomonas crocodyli TaxID=1979270 RepID=A0A437MB01_9SPHN|nr:DUF885 domain-containing protein [Sphingomonas crocodyli]